MCSSLHISLLNQWQRLDGGGLIGRLVHISHSQWLFQNFTLHDTQCGYNPLNDKLAVQLQISELSHTDPGLIPEHSRFLLEIDMEILKTSDFETQEVYWMTVMAAAILLTTASQPALTLFGSFTVRETIRQEVREILETGA